MNRETESTIWKRNRASPLVKPATISLACHICPQGKPNYSQNYWTDFNSFQGVQILFWIRNEKWHQSTPYTSCLVLSPALTFLNLRFRLKLADPGRYIRPQMGTTKMSVISAWCTLPLSWPTAKTLRDGECFLFVF